MTLDELTGVTTRASLQGRCLARLGPGAGGTLSFGLPTRSRVWLTTGLQAAGCRDEAWLNLDPPLKYSRAVETDSESL